MKFPRQQVVTAGFPSVSLNEGPMSESDLLTIERVAESLQISPRTVRNYIVNDMISAVKLGGLTRIRRAECERFIRDLPTIKPSARRRCAKNDHVDGNVSAAA